MYNVRVCLFNVYLCAVCKISVVFKLVLLKNASHLSFILNGNQKRGNIQGFFLFFFWECACLTADLSHHLYFIKPSKLLNHFFKFEYFFIRFISHQIKFMSTKFCCFWTSATNPTQLEQFAHYIRTTEFTNNSRKIAVILKKVEQFSKILTKNSNFTHNSKRVLRKFGKNQNTKRKIMGKILEIFQKSQLVVEETKISKNHKIERIYSKKLGNFQKKNIPKTFVDDEKHIKPFYIFTHYQKFILSEKNYASGRDKSK